MFSLADEFCLPWQAAKLEKVQWLELMGLSEWSERQRAGVRCIVDALVKLKKEAEKEKAETPNGSCTQQCFETWVRELNKITAVQCIQYIELLNSTEGQNYLMDFLDCLSLDMTWDETEMRLKANQEFVQKMDRYNQDAPGRHVELTQFESSLLDHGIFQIIGHEREKDWEPDDAFLKSMTTLKFQSRTSLLQFGRHVLSGQKALLYRANFALTPAVQLIHQDHRALALLLKALSDAGVDSKCFHSCIAVAILSEAIERTKWQLLLEFLVNDVAFIGLLMYVGNTEASAAFSASFICGRDEIESWVLHFDGMCIEHESQSEAEVQGKHQTISESSEL